MPEGKLCNRKPINDEEYLQEVLSDTGGKQYYEEMKELDVDVEKLQASLKATLKSRMKTWLEMCAHCGLCADACFLYEVNDRKPEQVPAYKIQSTLGEIVRKNGNVTNEFMRHCMDVAWSQCTCCNRCGHYCPHGIDMGVMFGYLRGLLNSQGFYPWELKIGSGMHRVYRAQMNVTTEDWVETCEWMAEETEEEWPGLTIPVDKEGADIMYTCNAREPKHYPEDIAEAAILFHLTGENWTVPSEGWEQTSLSMFAGDWEACTMQVKTVYDAIERLKPKRCVGTECGHAHRATAIEGPYWAGYENGQTPAPFIHYVEWVAEVLREGRLKIDPAKKLKRPVTLQDSCNYVRNHGLANITREIMSYIVDPEYFIEMTPNREHNYCCGGGGGFNGVGKYRPERNVALKKKRDQILATGAELVIAPCHNCWDAIRDLEEEFEIGIEWSFLKPLLIEMAIVPDHMKPQEDDE
ncbi:sulfate respiration complex iron-sulfur protein HmcF [Pseudodesulfovibrio sp. zrk46]|uniref:sulfate respiration complex iron-sulfur protein HmcF n=1 Tax=Pseudodesulfovibrio sp. zrk46 TaxID=2725288 RepID=UPI001448B20B|nr:(Fe-S)-binding protein [Pseudodesulfovibrio sp. zrk46]QJB56856.1 (Fe-S)-binding protein [Pseudodesulfovibrio sp. zrk46]